MWYHAVPCNTSGKHQTNKSEKLHLRKMHDLVLTDLVEWPDSDSHSDAVLAVHVWGFGPHGAAARYQLWQNEWSAAPSQRTTQDCVKLRTDLDTRSCVSEPEGSVTPHRKTWLTCLKEAETLQTWVQTATSKWHCFRLKLEYRKVG